MQRDFSKFFDLARAATIADETVVFKPSPECYNRTIFLADLPRNTTYHEIYSFFEQALNVPV